MGAEVETFIHSFNKHTEHLRFEMLGLQHQMPASPWPERLSSHRGDTATHGGKWEVAAEAKKKGKARWGGRMRSTCSVHHQARAARPEGREAGR